MGGVARKNFRLFRKVCGDDALKNVAIVTNMWGDVTEEIGSSREKELSESDLFFKPALEKGAKMMRHDNTSESAKRIIETFVGSTPEVLSIQREVVEEKKTIAQTAAGQDLEAELEKQLVKHKQEIETIRKEMASLLEEKDQSHQTEIQELTEALDDVKGRLAKYEQEQQTLHEEREADRKTADERARRLTKEMEDREAVLQELHEHSKRQEAQIEGLHEALADVEQRAREQELQKKEADELRKAQDAERQAELERMRREYEGRLAELARQANERKAERALPPPPPPPVPRAPWDVVREFTIGRQPVNRRGGFFTELVFAMDQMFSSRGRS